MLILAALPFASGAVAQDRVSEGATRARAGQFLSTEDWALRALMLLSLGPKYHPTAGEAAFLEAFRGKDERLKAFALSQLAGTDEAQLPAMATAELLEELIMKQLKARNPIYRQELVALLQKMVPAAKDEDAKGLKKWWRKAKKTWEPLTWTEPKGDDDGKRKETSSALVRALDLNAAGLDVVLAIDSTGSMQPAIDASHDALADIVDVLGGIAPDFRVGLVHYKDFDDFKAGAQPLEPLTKKASAVKTRLSRLSAYGGGDNPERVEAGLKVACSPQLGWRGEANKVVILMGDAPPHEDTYDELVEMAKTAREQPANAMNGFRPTSSKRAAKFRPFLVSTIFVKIPQHEKAYAEEFGSAKKYYKRCEDIFSKISEAGGGTHSSIRIGGGKDEAARSVVKNILQLSFGVEYREAVVQFIDTFYKWRDAGMWR